MRNIPEMMLSTDFVEGGVLLTIIFVVISISKLFIRYVLAQKFVKWRNKVIPTKMKEIRFQIAFYKLIACTFSVFLGTFVLFNESWALKLDLPGVERKVIPLKFKVYYFYEISFYINELMTIIYEPKKKDYIQMSTHHAITLLLMYLSFTPEYINYGVLLFLLHDVSDPLLECAKIEHYLENEVGSGIMLFTFATIFFVARLLLYPRYVLYTAITNAIKDGTIKSSPSMMMILLALSILQILHIIWSFFIGMIFLKVIKGEGLRDTREDKDD